MPEDRHRFDEHRGFSRERDLGYGRPRSPLRRRPRSDSPRRFRQRQRDVRDAPPPSDAWQISKGRTRSIEILYLRSPRGIYNGRFLDFYVLGLGFYVVNCVPSNKSALGIFITNHD